MGVGEVYGTGVVDVVQLSQLEPSSRRTTGVAVLVRAREVNARMALKRVDGAILCVAFEKRYQG
jgi:hypothetical protein